ncbi:MAG: hypothetical protein LBG72_09725 [Spirochaetaceae bacterium]|jgi:hypothetical protein|nr:hypothetical protein [Spirochaetaceae bacterium]
MKRFFYKTNLALWTALLCALLCASCGDGAFTDGTEEISLAWSVYAGEDAEGNWATFAFVESVNDEEQSEDTVYFFPDNALCYSGTYTCKQTAGTGAFGGALSGNIAAITPAGRNPPAQGAPPGAFTLSADEKTITFTNYRGQQVVRSFKRVRRKNAVDELAPFTYGALPENLDGTVWAATAFRTKDWTTLTIKAGAAAGGGTIQVSHSFDCTSFPRAYSGYAYNTEIELDYIGPFIIKDDIFTFQDFYGHGGKIPLFRMR